MATRCRWGRPSCGAGGRPGLLAAKARRGHGHAQRHGQRCRHRQRQGKGKGAGTQARVRARTHERLPPTESIQSLPRSPSGAPRAPLPPKTRSRNLEILGFDPSRFFPRTPRGGIPRERGKPSNFSTRGLRPREVLRPISILRFWISEGLTQA